MGRKGSPLTSICFLMGVVPCCLILHFGMLHVSMNRPETAVGAEGLAQVHRYLGLLLAVTLAVPLTIITGSVLGTLIFSRVKNCGYKYSYVIASVVLAFGLMFFIPKRSEIDFQQEVKGYGGWQVVQMARMYYSCGRDLKEQSTREAVLKGAATDVRDYSYTVGGKVHRYVELYEYYLQDADDRAQLMVADCVSVNRVLADSGEHKAEFYEHSGLLAAIDGEDPTGDDEPDMFRISLERDVVTRTNIENEDELEDFKLVVEYGGQVMDEVPMSEGSSGCLLPNLYKGGYCYLQIKRDGKLVRVSNMLKM